jgi:hypothetical protein
MVFSDPFSSVHAPDGARVLRQHEPVRIRASAGNAPDSPSAVAFYRARAFAAKGASWYASAIGDIGDWDYGGDRDNPARAVSGNLALAGRKGEGVTALMAVDDSRLYAATARSLYVMQEPTKGMSKVSDAVGCIGPYAWCSADGVLYTLSTQGLFRIVPGEAPARVDAEIPQALKGATTALLAYDPEEDAVHMFTDKGDFFFEIASRAFWPQAYESSARPGVVGRCVLGGVDSVVFCGSDGTWRQFDADSSEEVQSCVAVGPFWTSGRDDEDGMLDTLHMVLAEGSDDVAVELYPARTAEAALNKAEASQPSPAFSAEVGAGFNHTIRPRVRGAWCVAVLRGTGAWAFETATATCKQLGRLR